MKILEWERKDFSWIHNKKKDIYKKGTWIKDEGKGEEKGNVAKKLVK